MVECPRCHSDLPDDSIYCMYCGQSITDTTRTESDDAAAAHDLAENPEKNPLGLLSLLMMVGTLVLFDFIGGTVLQALGLNYRIPFYISTVLYVVCMAVAVLSIVVDRRARKAGYAPSGNLGLPMATIVFSIVIILMNLQQVVFA